MSQTKLSIHRSVSGCSSSVFVVQSEYSRSRLFEVGNCELSECMQSKVRFVLLQETGLSLSFLNLSLLSFELLYLFPNLFKLKTQSWPTPLPSQNSLSPRIPPLFNDRNAD